MSWLSPYFLADRLLLLRSRALARHYRKELDELLLSVARACSLLAFEHRLRELVELLAEVAARFHPAAFRHRALHAVIIVGESHVDRQAQQLLNLLRSDERPFLGTVQQNRHAIA